MNKERKKQIKTAHTSGHVTVSLNGGPHAVDEIPVKRKLLNVCATDSNRCYPFSK